MVESSAASRSEAGAAVGTRWGRTDGLGKVRGTVRYVADQPAPRCLCLALHRATRPHARLTGIDVDEARRAPGVVAVFTGDDLYAALGEAIFTGPAFSDQPPLAFERVRFVGEPVVAVLARTRREARAAADLVSVEYEDLEPVHDVTTAIAGRAFVHEELRPSIVFGDLAHLRGVRDTNVNYTYRLRAGDPEAAEAAVVTRFGATFWSPPVHHVPIELPCTMAWPSGSGLEILSTTQTPSYVRQCVADLLGLPLNAVRVRTGPLGGSFGSKMYDRLEPLVAAVAHLASAPVRLQATREEAFLLTTRHGALVEEEMGLDAEGRIVTARAEVAYETGAYADVGPRITAKSGMVALGPYKIANASITSRCVYTNKPSAGPFRGFGVPQVCFAHESVIDELARASGADPVAFRRSLLLREGDTAVVGTRMHSADFVTCLDRVAEALDWASPLRPASGRLRRGRGVAVGVKAVLTPTVANAVLQFNSDASASLMISTVDMGQGSDTIMAQIAAEVLHLGPGAVKVVPVDTDVTPYDTITAGSRSTYHTGNAVRMAAESMRDRLLEIGAAQLHVADTDVKLTADGVSSGTTGETRSLEDLLRAHFGARGTTLSTEANFSTSWEPYDHETGRSEKVTEHWFAGAVGVELTVDVATGRIVVEHLAVAGDVGRAINPTLVEQQLVGAAVMGLGHALFDELVFDGGQILNGTLLDYQVPSLRDLPARITPIVVESPHRDGPFGAKGVGETGIIPLAPAVANAVRDAVGVRITQLPLSPERVLGAMAGGR